MDFPTAAELKNRTVRESELELHYLKQQLIQAAESGKTSYFDYDRYMTPEIMAYLQSLGYEVADIHNLYDIHMWKISWE